MQLSPTLKGIQESDVVVLLVGLTGVGKSTFINKAAGSSIAIEGDGLDTCTKTIQSFPVPFPDKSNRRVIFVDTPGFNADGGWVGDQRLLRTIFDWLNHPDHENAKLSGIVYLHDLSQARLASAKDSVQLFSDFSRQEILNHVIFASSKWSEVPENVGKEREKQLFEQYCRGRTMAQFRNSEESAWNIVHLAEEKTPVLFSHIYRELAGLQSDISDTKPNTGPRTWFTQLFGRANG